MKKAAPKNKKEDAPAPKPKADEEDDDVAPQPRKRARPVKPAAEKEKPAAKPRVRAKKVVEEDEDEEADEVQEENVAEKVLAPKVVPQNDDDDSVLSDLPDGFPDEPEPPKKKLKQSVVQSPSSKKARSIPKALKSAKAEPVNSEDEEECAPKAEGNGDAVGGESGDESEMSVVLDETPQKKGRGHKAAPVSGDADKKKGKAAAAKPKKAAAAKPKKATKAKAAVCRPPRRPIAALIQRVTGKGNLAR